MITALIFFLILLVLVLIHEFGHFFAAKKQNVYVEEFGFGFPPRVLGKKIGETLYSFNLLPLGGFVKLFGEEYHEEDADEHKKKKIPKERAFVNKKPWQKVLIIIGGVIMNFVLGWALISYLFTVGTPSPNGVSIAEVIENSPAAESGLQKGDKVLKLVSKEESVDINMSMELIQGTNKYAGEEIILVIDRDGEQQELYMTPRENPPEGEGSLGIVINQIVETKTYPWYTAPYYGLLEAANMTRMIFVEILKIPAQLIGQEKTQVDFAGPVGIANIVGEARQYGINALLQLTALLSLNLAVINILPFPALDGGRLVFILYEWITGKKTNQNLEKYLNLIGIILLLGLAAVVTIFDIMRLTQ